VGVMPRQDPGYCRKDILLICQNLLGHFVPELMCLTLGPIRWMDRRSGVSPRASWGPDITPTQPSLIKGEGLFWRL
jgi:hypothetical protein